MQRILILEQQADEYLDLLSAALVSESYELIASDSVKYCPTDIDILLAQPDLAAELLSRPLSQQQMPRWIQSTWAGVKPLIPLLTQAQDKQIDITLTGVKGIFGPLMAEYVFAYLIESVRDNHFLQAQQQQHLWSNNYLPGTLLGKTICLLGTGSIGQHIAMVAKAFGMNTVGYGRSSKQLANFDRFETGLTKALNTADFVVASLPATAETEKLMNKTSFASMKRGSIFINVGRSATLDEPALIQALTDGQLSSAVLDVFDSEPLPKSHQLWDIPNLTLTPHVAAPSLASDITKIFLDNLTRFENKSSLQFVVDIKKGY